MFDWNEAIEDEKDGVVKYEQAAKEMEAKYPHSLYAMQFRLMAKQEAKHLEALQEMQEKIAKKSPQV